MERFLEASKAVSEGSRFRTSAKQDDIHRTTLIRFIERQMPKLTDQKFLTGHSHLANTKKVVNSAYEIELVSRVKKLSDSYFGISD